ncbi:MAG: PA14 domain-containing protein, partial [Candidatus Thermoplasmatota archaeon]|nr:PA14 domain-containing protein [Candidatus Thermoplasmatota archaeon]
MTGYTVETALGLIDKANNSLGQRGDFVLDLASNRNGSGYKFWNDDLYVANSSLNGTMGLPVIFNQNSTFLTNISNVIAYASWGSNDGEWNKNQLSNGGFDTQDASWSSGSRYWNISSPTVSNGDGFEWAYQTNTKQGGNGAQEAQIYSQCSQESGYMQQGIHAEYFDNQGISFNTASMPDLIDRVPDHIRIESSLAYSSSGNAYPGLDDRFKNNWGARFSGLIQIPETGNWTFYLNSDDGSELWIDGLSAIQNYGSHGMVEYSTSMNLTAGLHDFRVEFFQGGGPHGLIVSWKGPNVSKSSIPASAYFVANDAIPQSEHLLHAWDFEEGSGNQTNNSVDDSHFQLYGMNSSNWRNCVDGNCLWFDGINDRAEVEVDDWTGDFSISQWVWANSTNQSTYASTFAIDDN